MKVITFGCRLNIFESAAMEKLAADALSNVILFNTCAVTGEAERQLRQAIRRTKRENPEAKIYVAGCAAQLHPEVYAKMTEVDRVLGNREKLIRSALLGTDKMMAQPMENDSIQVDMPVVSDFDGKTKAFLQIQQGCDNACTFCVVSLIRGKNQGLSPDTILSQAKEFIKNGYSELILTGVDLAAYPYGFCDLVKRLLHETDGLKRLRFGSLDPARLDDAFIELMASDRRLMPYLHLSVQSGDNLILKRMARRHRRQDIIEFAKKLRAVRPDVVLGADFITGFPTETEVQFQNTMNLVEEAGITHLHVFPYSEREGTAAAKMPQLPKEIRKDRARRLRELGQQKMNALLEAQIGRTLSVLVEKQGEGSSDNYLKVFFDTPAKIGDIIDIEIKGRNEHGLVG